MSRTIEIASDVLDKVGDRALLPGLDGDRGPEFGEGCAVRREVRGVGAQVGDDGVARGRREADEGLPGVARCADDEDAGHGDSVAPAEKSSSTAECRR